MMYGVVKRHSRKVRESLGELGVELLIMEENKGLERLRMQLLMFSDDGKVLNLTGLRKEKYSLYRELFEYGSPSQVTEEMGFLPIYSYKGRHEEELVTHLYDVADGNMILSNIEKKTYERILYFAYKSGQSVRDYLLDKGFGLMKGGTRVSKLKPYEVFALRTSATPLSWSTIAKEAGVTVAMVRKTFQRYAEEVGKLDHDRANSEAI